LSLQGEPRSRLSEARLGKSLEKVPIETRLAGAQKTRLPPQGSLRRQESIDVSCSFLVRKQVGLPLRLALTSPESFWYTILGLTVYCCYWRNESFKPTRTSSLNVLRPYVL
jgi:hypothetical protein